MMPVCDASANSSTPHHHKRTDRKGDQPDAFADQPRREDTHRRERRADELENWHFGKDYLLLFRVQQREIENTGITSFKIAFNNVFGNYIEVRNTHKRQSPGRMDP